MSTFPVRKFRHSTVGSVVEGELVLESHTAWQVAVGGKVQVLEKTEWSIDAGDSFNDLFGQRPGMPNLFDPFSMFGGRRG